MAVLPSKFTGTMAASSLPPTLRPDSLSEATALSRLEKATIYSPDESNTIFNLVGGATMPDIKVEVFPGHMAEFARAALGGEPARSNFPDDSGPLAETVLLGKLAVRADGPWIEWDARRMQTKGSHEFDEIIHPKYRHGWISEAQGSARGFITGQTIIGAAARRLNG